MGKAADNKQQKLDALYQSAYDLFLQQGIENTSISEIAKNAGVAKGTFYLYFTDKYELRDRLIARTAGQLFLAATDALRQANIPAFEDQMIFIVDYVLQFMQRNKPVLRFISKNLSWGMFRQAVTQKDMDSPVSAQEIFRKLLENPAVRLRAPETMLFLIIELASSASYSTILENDPIPFEQLQPDLNESIRAIVRSHLLPCPTATGQA